MGNVVAAKSYLRAWGSDKYLDTKGMFKTNLSTSSGAKKRMPPRGKRGRHQEAAEDEAMVPRHGQGGGGKGQHLPGVPGEWPGTP